MGTRRHPNALINRRNWSDSREYLKYCLEVKRNKPRTVESVRGALDHLLQWATDIPLSQAADIRPSFVEYMEGKDISPSFRNKVLEYSRNFFYWAREELTERYPFKRTWIESLKSKLTDEDDENSLEVFSLQMVRAITALTPRTLAEERDIAGVAFLFLSGMRDGAFVSLPFKAVDWSKNPVPVRQWVKYRVRTKNSKSATTFLLPHPELEDLRQIARAWQEKAKPIVGENGMWYTMITSNGDFDVNQTPGLYRITNLARRLEDLCDRAGIEYIHPHAIRHGHVQFAMSFCRSMDELKAISQNVMHESITTTEAIYGEMPSDIVANTLAEMATRRTGEDDNTMRLAANLFKQPKIKR